MTVQDENTWKPGCEGEWPKDFITRTTTWEYQVRTNLEATIYIVWGPGLAEETMAVSPSGRGNGVQSGEGVEAVKEVGQECGEPYSVTRTSALPIQYEFRLQPVQIGLFATGGSPPDTLQITAKTDLLFPIASGSRFKGEWYVFVEKQTD
jgi:hypothetical protein